MRRPTLSVIGLLALVLASGQAQERQRTAILPPSEASGIPNLFLRPLTKKITGTWQPTKADFSSLEANLPKISQMSIYGWPAFVRIEHPDQYYRQYVAVTIDGQNEIFINASCEEPPADWLTHLAQYVDGATCFWRAFFNPATKEFSDLDINARA